MVQSIVQLIYFGHTILYPRKGVIEDAVEEPELLGLYVHNNNWPSLRQLYFNFWVPLSIRKVGLSSGLAVARFATHELTQKPLK